jgi:hypothetical protein
MITKKLAKSTTILMTMPPGGYGAMRIAQWSASLVHAKPLDAAIGQVHTLYCPGSCHG